MLFRKIFLLISLFLFSTANCFAYIQTEDLWLAVNSLHTLSDDKKWLSFIYSRLQFVNQNQPWQAGLIENGIGYELVAGKTVWLGYRWTGRNPNNGFYIENRLFQQLIWDMRLNQFHRFISRSRLEQTQRADQSQISWRFRERAAFAWGHPVFFHNLFPFLYDEIFFQLNKTNYTPHYFIAENRVFIGFNLHHAKKGWWEIGYINQFRLRTPLINQNQIDHILSVTYNLL